MPKIARGSGTGASSSTSASAHDRPAAGAIVSCASNRRHGRALAEVHDVLAAHLPGQRPLGPRGQEGGKPHGERGYRPRDNGAMGLRSRVLAASIVLALIVGAIFAILLVAIGELRDSSAAARHSEQVLAAANRLERRVIDLETGLRGLLLTRDERFLTPFRSAQAAVPPEAKRLQGLVANNPEQMARAKLLATSIDDYLKGYVVPEVLHGQLDTGSPKAIRVIGEGKRRIDDLRAQFSQFITAENALAQTRRDSADSQARTAVLIGVSGLVVSVLLILAFSGYLTTALLRPIARVATGARRLAGGDLSARVDERGPAEMGELARTFNVMATSLEENRDQLKSQNAELEASQGELEHAVEQLAEEKRQVEVLHRFGERLQEHAELEPLAAAALDDLCELARCEVGALYARGRDERTRDGATLLAAHGVRGDRQYKGCGAIGGLEVPRGVNSGLLFGSVVARVKHPHPASPPSPPQKAWGGIVVLF